jgi:hypothetical protein
MFGLLGAFAGGTKGMTRDELVGENSPPDSEKPNAVKRALRAAGENSPPAQPRWIRNVNDYDRRQPREYQVSRFG